ncbi:OleI family self-immunity macrolide glycosyltransferase [Streptomyces sp. NBRC 110028]|uniref:OleI family self-immunity macrolide glycosyltransferase n=1 Tax=Streptomyces sp. NBRC 110028 TaxID=1621260 RepID=UPI0006E41461|nr:OleI family self-immunity macrolide glycosyltransferase [Streptomyces sp. NBRC 110028]
MTSEYRSASVTPRHISFFNIPGHGHVNPSLGIVQELVARGHRVSYAITEEFAAQVKAAGATPVVYDSILPKESNPEESWPEDQESAMGLFLDEAVRVLPQLEDAYADDRPDLIVYDIASWPAPVLGRKWDIPFVQLSPTFVAYEGFEEDVPAVQDPTADRGEETAAPAQTGDAEEGAEAEDGLVRFFTRLSAFLQEHGVDTPATEFLIAPNRCIVALPRTFQIKGDTVGDNYTFVGPTYGDRSHQGTWEGPGDGRPVLLIALGSAFTDHLDFYRTCLAAVDGLDWHVVLSVGRFVDPADLGEVPPNVEVHQWVPQLDILTKASAFITHAGMGSTMEALSNAVPTVAVPQIAEQTMNAERIVELGLGRHIPRDEVTAEKLREAVLAVASDPGVAERLAAVRQEIREAGGARAAADILEGILAEAG